MKPTGREKGEEVVALVRRCRAAGARSGHHYVVGANQSMRLLERGRAAGICICKENSIMVTYLMEAAFMRGVPVVFLPPGLAGKFGTALDVRRASCFTLMREGLTMIKHAKTQTLDSLTSIMEALTANSKQPQEKSNRHPAPPLLTNPPSHMTESDEVRGSAPDENALLFAQLDAL